MAGGKVGEAYIAIGADTSEVGPEMESGVMGAVQRVGSAAVKAAGVAAAAGLGATIAVGFSTAMESEIANMKFTQLFKGDLDKAQSYIQELKDFAAKTPFDFPGLQDAAGRFLAVGVEAERVIPIMTTLGDATSIMGTGAEGIDRATTALTQMSQKGKVTGEEMMQLTEAGIPAWESLAASMGLPIPELQKMVSDGLVPADEMYKALETSSGEALSTMAGGMEKMSQTTQGKISTLKDEFAQFAGRLMDDALPAVNSFVDFAIDTLIPAVESVVAWIKDDLVPAIQSLGQWLEDNSGKIAAVAGVIFTIFLPSLVMMGGQALIQGAKVVASWVMQTAASAVSFAAQAITFAALGWHYAILGAKAVGNAAKVAGAWVLQTGAAVAAKAAQLPVFLWQAGQWVVAGVKALAGAAMQVLAWTMQKAPMLITVGLMIINFALMAAGWVASAVAAMASAVIMAAAWLIALGPVGLIIAAVIAVVAIFALLWVKCEGFREFWINLWETVKTFFVEVWENIKAFFQQAVDWIKEKLQAFVDRAKAIWEGIKDLVSKAKETLTNLWQAFKDGIASIIENVKGWVGDIVDGFKSAVDRVVQIGKDIVSGLWDGIKSMGTWIKDKVVGFVSNIIPGPIKDILGISSPSKVTAELGKEVSRGLALGIEAEAKVVGRASAGISSLAVPAVPDIALPTSAFARGAPVQAAPATGSVNNITVNLSMDDLAQLQTLDEFLRMLARERSDRRRTERSGRVVV